MSCHHLHHAERPLSYSYPRVSGRQSESVIADLLDDKAELSRQVDDAAQEARLQDEALAHCKATVADLAAQLAASYQAREEGVHRVARYDIDRGGPALVSQYGNSL